MQQKGIYKAVSKLVVTLVVLLAEWFPKLIHINLVTDARPKKMLIPTLLIMTQKVWDRTLTSAISMYTACLLVIN